MSTDPNANTRAALERLMQEFASASSDDAPILHQRLYGLPDQQLTKRTWEHFRLANDSTLARKKQGEWQAWVPHPDGTACSLFVSNGDKAALDRFRRLADTGTALLKMASANPEPTWHFDKRFVEQIEAQPNDETYLCWLNALHLTATQCRTMFLHATIGNWSYSPMPGETVEQVATAMSEPTPFGLVALPIHPIVESLQHDVFRSSAEAIKVWLGMDDVVHVGDWPERPPIFLPQPSQAQQHGGESEVIAASSASSASTGPKLVIDRDTFTAWYNGEKCFLGNTIPFKVLVRLNQRPGTFVRIASLIDDVWGDVDTEDATVQRTVSSLRKKLKDAFGEQVTIDGEQQDHYRLILS